MCRSRASFPSRKERHEPNDHSVLVIRPTHSPSFRAKITTQVPHTHLAAVKRIIWHHEGRLDSGVTYGMAGGLHGYTDVHWASDWETRRSGGACVFLSCSMEEQLAGAGEMSAFDRNTIM